MRQKLTLAVILAVIAIVWPATVVKPSPAPTPTPTLGVNIDCIGLPYSMLRCAAEVYGGTPPFTYQWGPPPVSGTGHAIRVGCAGSGSIILAVTVTDANGETGYYSADFLCSLAGGPPQ